MITTNNIIYEENGGITLFSVHIYEKVSWKENCRIN